MHRSVIFFVTTLGFHGIKSFLHTASKIWCSLATAAELKTLNTEIGIASQQVSFNEFAVEFLLRDRVADDRQPISLFQDRLVGGDNGYECDQEKGQVKVYSHRSLLSGVNYLTGKLPD